eukprot:806917_1
MSSSSVDEQLANATIITDDIWQQSKYRREKSLKLLQKIYKNIKNKPNDAKYRKLNMSKILSKQDILPQVRQILLCSGFIPNNNGIHVDLNDNNLNLCIAVGDMIAERINDEQIQLEKEREKIRQETKQKQQKYLNKNKEKKELVKKQIDANRKDKKNQSKQVVSSKAKKLNFGRKDVKVDFKTSGGGGG